MDEIRHNIRVFLYSDKASWLFLPIIFVVNLLWFYQLEFHTMAGDDLVRWFQISEFTSFSRNFSFILDGTKYRPINDICHFILFKLFSSNYSLFFYFNILFNFVIGFALYKLIKKITHSNSLIAFSISLLYITSRFSYFSILQIYGIMESFALLLLILIVFSAVGVIRTGEDRYVISMSVFNLLIVFTHERYLVLLPFLALVVMFFYASRSHTKKGLLLLITFLPFFLNIFLKKVIFKVPFAQRTGTISLDLSVASIAKNIGFGLLKVVGINNGPEYLNLISFSDEGTFIKITSVFIAGLIFLIFLLGPLRFTKLPAPEKNKEVKLFFLWCVLFFSLLFSASIVSGQEQRWLYPAFVVLLIYLSHLFINISLSRFKIAKHLLFGILFFLIIHNDFYYKNYLSNLYFVETNTIADSFYDETVKKYGTKIADYSLYIEKFRDYGYILQGPLFFKPYIRDKEVKITYVDDIKEIDSHSKNQERTLIYALDWKKQKIIDLKDVKPPVLKRFGPEAVHAGQIFNRQPNGESAIWAETEHATPTTVFVLNGVPLESGIQPDGKAASAVVPKSMYEKPGEYTLCLLDRKTNQKSNEVKFIVKP